MKKYILLGVIVALCTIGFSQRPGGKKHHKNPELRKELRAFKLNKINPLIEKEQAEFDSQLSSSDLAFIQAKRLEAAQMHQEGKAMKKKMRAARKARKENNTENPDFKPDASDRAAFKNMMSEHRAKKKALAESLKDFGQRNESLITSSMTDLKAQKEALQPEMDAILTKHGVDPASFKKRRKDGEHKRGRGHHGKRRMDADHEGPGSEMKDLSPEERKAKREEFRKRKAALHFILWSKAAEVDAEERGAFQKNLAPDLGQNFPNPANDYTTVTFDLPQETQNVSLLITDINGKSVKNLELGNLPAGENRLDIELDGMNSGTYFYTIKAGKFTETKKMMINK